MKARSARFTWTPIPGGEVQQGYALGRRTLEIKPQKILTLEANTSVLFVSDLHLGLLGRKGAAYKRLYLLRDLLLKYPGIPVVLGGDLLEYHFNKMSHLKKLMRKSNPRNKTHKIWLEVIDNLRDRKVVLLPGNHDPAEWYEKGDWKALTGWEVEPYLILKIGEERILMTHGHELYEEIDKLFVPGIHRVPRLITRWLSFCNTRFLAWFGPQFLQWSYQYMNLALETYIDGWKVAFGVDKVIMGHIHQPWENQEKGLYVSGVFMQHFRSYTLVKEDGEVSIHPQVIRFSQYLKHATEEA